MRIYKCPDCGNEFSEGSTMPVECPTCGCPFEKFEMIEIVDEPQPRKFCPKCGSLLPSGQVKFCPNCGYQLGKSATHEKEKQIHKPPVRRRSALHVVLVIIGIIGAAIGSICLENIDFTPPTITKDSQSSSSSSASRDFTSEQDVIDYCYGKTFRPDYFDLSTTVYGSDDISVMSYTSTTAIVKIWFDMGPVTGRAYKDCLRFKIDKETGSIKQIHGDEE